MRPGSARDRSALLNVTEASFSSRTRSSSGSSTSSGASAFSGSRVRARTRSGQGWQGMSNTPSQSTRKRLAGGSSARKKPGGSGDGGGGGGPVRRTPKLKKILDNFGIEDFSVASTCSQHFRQKTLSQSKVFRDELQSNKDEASAALRTFVTQNYTKFIDSSNAIVNLETKMQNLHQALSRYRDTMDAIGRTKLDLDFGQHLADGSQARNHLSKNRAQSYLNEHNIRHHFDSEDILANLNGLIFERKFEQATDIIEGAKDRLQEFPPDRRAVLEQEINERISEIVALAINELRSSVDSAMGELRIARILDRLGKADKAVEIFLENRSSSMQRAIRQLEFQGDIVTYISDLTRTFQSHLEKTVDDYKSFFPQQPLTSGLVVWAVQEIENYYKIFHRQVFNNVPVHKKIGICLELMFELCQSIEDRGMTLQPTLDKLLLPPVRDMVRDEYKKLTAQLIKEVENDTWETIEMSITNKRANSGGASSGLQSVKVSQTGKRLYEMLQEFVRRMRKIFAPKGVSPFFQRTLFGNVCQGIMRFFEEYLLSLTTVARQKDLSETQSLGLLANVFYLYMDLLDRIVMQFERIFQQEPKMLERFGGKVKRLYNAQISFFSQKHTPKWVEDVLHWSSVSKSLYSLAVIDDDGATPSQVFCDLVQKLWELEKTIARKLGRSEVESVLSHCLIDLFGHIGDRRYFPNSDKDADRRKSDAADGGDSESEGQENNTVVIGHGGLQQFVLDIRFLVGCVQDHINQRVHQRAQKLIRLCLRAYCDQTKLEYSEEELYSDEWFRSKITARLRSLRKERKSKKIEHSLSISMSGGAAAQFLQGGQQPSMSMSVLSERADSVAGGGGTPS